MCGWEAGEEKTMDTTDMIPTIYYSKSVSQSVAADENRQLPFISLLRISAFGHGPVTLTVIVAFSFGAVYYDTIFDSLFIIFA